MINFITIIKFYEQKILAGIYLNRRKLKIKALFIK